MKTFAPLKERTTSRPYKSKTRLLEMKPTRRGDCCGSDCPTFRLMPRPILISLLSGFLF